MSQVSEMKAVRASGSGCPSGGGGGGGSGASALQSESWEPQVLQFYDPQP